METGFSVLISIHKSLSPVYFQEAMQSVLGQSRQADEIILVEDGKLGRPLLEIVDLFKTKLFRVSKETKKFFFFAYFIFAFTLFHSVLSSTVSA